MAVRLVRVHEGSPTAWRVDRAREIDVNESLEVGREGQVALGVHTNNPGISRLAVRVTARETGWGIFAVNRNGVIIHPWGQAPLRADPRTSVNWPLVGLRILPDTDRSQHWVLLETDAPLINPAGPVLVSGATRTERVDPPGPLPPAEREALCVVFAAHLSWPPSHPAEPLLLKQASTRLGLSISGLQDRLTAARTRALRLGQTTVVGLTDPSYLYALVRGGYLEPPFGLSGRVSRKTAKD